MTADLKFSKALRERFIACNYLQYILLNSSICSASWNTEISEQLEYFVIVIIPFNLSV